MKFTHGYWVIRENFTMSYAQQWVRTDIRQDQVNVKAACHPIRSRGDAIGGAMLNVTLSAPRPNVIRIKLEHFQGKKANTPQFETFSAPCSPVITEDENMVVFQSGELRAQISKGSWEIGFYGGGRLLTSTGYRGMAHAWDVKADQTWMVDSLSLIHI